MRRLSIGLLAALLLACAGLDEWIELAQDGPSKEQIVERPDGFDLELPDGNGVHVYWGDDITQPAQIPLPAPPDSMLISWAEADLPLVEPAFLAMYGTLTPQKEVVAFYRDALKAQGVDFQRNKDAESGSVALTGSSSDAHLLAAIHPDGAVLLAAGPRQAVELAALHARDHQDRNPRRWIGPRSKAKRKADR